MSSALQPQPSTRRHHHGARRTMLHCPHTGGLRTSPTDSSHRSCPGSVSKILPAAQRPLRRTIALRLLAHTLSTQGERRCSEQPPRRRCNRHRSTQPINRHQRRDRSQQRKSGCTCQRRSSKLCNEPSAAFAAILPTSRQTRRCMMIAQSCGNRVL